MIESIVQSISTAPPMIAVLIVGFLLLLLGVVRPKTKKFQLREPWGWIIVSILGLIMILTYMTILIGEKFMGKV